MSGLSYCIWSLLTRTFILYNQGKFIWFVLLEFILKDGGGNLSSKFVPTRYIYSDQGVVVEIVTQVTCTEGDTLQPFHRMSLEKLCVNNIYYISHINVGLKGVVFPYLQKSQLRHNRCVLPEYHKACFALFWYQPPLAICGLLMTKRQPFCFYSR